MIFPIARQTIAKGDREVYGIGSDSTWYLCNAFAFISAADAAAAAVAASPALLPHIRWMETKSECKQNPNANRTFYRWDAIREMFTTIYGWLEWHDMTLHWYEKLKPSFEFNARRPVAFSTIYLNKI